MSTVTIDGYTPAELAVEVFRSAPSRIAWAWLDAWCDAPLTSEQRAALAVELHALTDRLDAGGCLDHAHHYDCTDDCHWHEVPCLVDSVDAAPAARVAA